ncbi:MAG TPA: MATE family efflux transporter [Candidatus Faecousia intestinigallinarum]|nr:MATE family efflux transporter [Candidatus Faecousia intestinigallinarum]
MKLYLKDRAFYKIVLGIALPVVLQSLITSGVNMMDTLMLTAYGEAQLSGGSLANQFISLFQFSCMGIGFGAAVLTARYWGSGNMTAFHKVTTLMLRACFVLSAPFILASLLIPEQIMALYTPDEAIIFEGVRYLRLSAFTFILNGLTITVSAVLRSAHKLKLPLAASVVAFFSNVFFNWVFIFGKLGVPAMEIEGAAIGTLLSRILECGMVVGYFLFFEKDIGYRFQALFLHCREYWADYIRFCIPVLLSDTLLGLGNNMISVLMGHMGGSYVSAFALVSQLTRMTTVLTQGLSSAASVIIGNALGRRQKQKAYDMGVTFLILASAVGVIASGILLAITPMFVKIGTLTAETQGVAIQLMRSVSVTIIFSTIQSILTKGVLRGAGDTRFLMVADILFLWLASIPLGYLAGLVWHCSAFVVYLALHTDWIIKAVWCSLRLLGGKWLNYSTKAEAVTQ